MVRDMSFQGGPDVDHAYLVAHQVQAAEAEEIAPRIAAVVNAAWHHRFSPYLSAVSIDYWTHPDGPTAVPRILDGIEGRTTWDATYTVVHPEGQPGELLGVSRIDRVVPKVAGIQYRPDYPSVSDVEAIPDVGQTSVVGGSALFFGLSGFESTRRIHVFSEVLNTEGNVWFHGFGLEDTPDNPSQPLLHGEAITYHKLKHGRNGVATVRNELLHRYGTLKFAMPT